VKIIYVYKSLAHPEMRGNFVQPFTIEERLAHARQAVKQLGSTIPWIVDPMDNRFKHAMGDRPNSEFVIDRKGMIVRKRAWSDPVELRKDLEVLVGKVEKITRAEDLNIKEGPTPAEPAAKGVVERVSRAGLFALVSRPQIEKDGPQFYAKLRAEAEVSVFDQGKGQLYLGFHLDPIHQAHWNNLQKPLRFEIEAPEGVKLSKNSAEAPTVRAASDIDPREFLLDVEAWPEGKSLKLSVVYSACTDQTCHVVKQRYVLHRERDKDGGVAPSAGFRGLTAEAMLKRVMAGDKNGDGKLTKDELNSLLQGRFEEFDLNKNSALDKDEIEKMADLMTKRIKP
jgi:hypothetical protein